MAAKNPAETVKPKKKDQGQEKAAADTPAAQVRPPADPRHKVYKKFHGKFLPKGPLRDRLKVIQQKWDATPNHDGVTLEELQALHADWMASRGKPVKSKV
jgi:hypothetical protein